MNILTERDWKIMKRPLYPNIEFISSENKIHIQSMLGLMIEGVEYYLPVIKIKEINEINDFWGLTEEYTNIIKELVDKYLKEGFTEEVEENIYKIEKA